MMKNLILFPLLTLLLSAPVFAGPIATPPSAVERLLILLGYPDNATGVTNLITAIAGSGSVTGSGFALVNSGNGDTYFFDPVNHAFGLVQTNGFEKVWTNGMEYQIGSTNRLWAGNITAVTNLNAGDNLTVGTNGWKVTVDGNQNFSGLWDRFVGPKGLTNSNTELVIYTNNIPAHSIGTNGILKVGILGVCASVSAGATVNVRLGGGTGTIVAGCAFAATASTLRSEWEERRTFNQNSESAQVAWPTTSATYGDSGNVLISATVDTTTNLPIAITLISNSATGTNAVVALDIEILHK